jgi:hypothetical protein
MKWKISQPTSSIVALPVAIRPASMSIKSGQRSAMYLRGFKTAPIEGMRLVDCEFRSVAKPNVIENVKDLSLQAVQVNGKLISNAG